MTNMVAVGGKYKGLGFISKAEQGTVLDNYTNADYAKYGLPTMDKLTQFYYQHQAEITLGILGGLGLLLVTSILKKR